MMSIRLKHVAALGFVALLATVTSPAVAGAGTANGWSIVHSSPEFPRDDLTDIAATGPDDAWAVGSGPCCEEADSQQIIHWDGTGWRPITPPAPPQGTNYPSLTNVAASSPADVWVFGIGSEGLAFAQHWDGTAWKATALGQGVRVNDAAVTGPASAWFVGTRETGTGEEPIAGRYDGQGWSVTPLPATAWEMSASADRDVWALGSQEDGTLVTMRWTGSSWRTLPLPRPSLPRGVFALPGDVLALGPDNVWASATLGKDEGVWPGSVLWHWNGRRWSKTRIDAPQDSLRHLASDGRGGLWMVSFNFTDVADRLLHYSGGRVTGAPVPLGEGTSASIMAITLVPGTGSLLAAGTLQTDDAWAAAIWGYGGQAPA
jgi:hypothetical protein